MFHGFIHYFVVHREIESLDKEKHVYSPKVHKCYTIYNITLILQME